MIKKEVKNEKVKSKLTLAFFILYYFDPISFHILKTFQKKKQKRTKDVLHFNVKSFKVLLTNYFFSLIHNQKKNKKEKLLLIKNYMTFLEKFNHQLKDKSLKKLKKKKGTFFTYKISSKGFFYYKSSSFLTILNYLDDFLNV